MRIRRGLSKEGNLQLRPRLSRWSQKLKDKPSIPTSSSTLSSLEQVGHCFPRPLVQAAVEASFEFGFFYKLIKSLMRPTGKLSVVEEEGAKRKKQKETEKEQIERLRAENEQLRLKMLSLKKETQKKSNGMNNKHSNGLPAKEKEKQLKVATNRLKYVHRENEKTLKDIKRAESFRKKVENSKLTAQEHKELKEYAKILEQQDLENRRQRASSVRNMRAHTKEILHKRKEDVNETAKVLREKEKEEKEMVNLQNSIRQERNKHLVLEVSQVYR